MATTLLPDVVVATGVMVAAAACLTKSVPCVSDGNDDKTAPTACCDKEQVWAGVPAVRVEDGKMRPLSRVFTAKEARSNASALKVWPPQDLLRLSESDLVAASTVDAKSSLLSNVVARLRELTETTGFAVLRDFCDPELVEAAKSEIQSRYALLPTVGSDIDSNREALRKYCKRVVESLEGAAVGQLPRK